MNAPAPPSPDPTGVSAPFAAKPGVGRDMRLTFPDLGRTISARPEETIFQAARRQGLRLVGACGGRGTCGACTIRVTEGVFLGEDGREARADGLDKAGRPRRKWRRACRVTPLGDLVVEVAPRSLAPVVRAEVASSGSDRLPFDPGVRRETVKVTPPSLADTASDAERVLRAMAAPAAGVDIAALRRLPDLLRAHDWTVDAVVRDGRVVSVAPPGSRLLGLAIDLGTTNVVGHLIDLADGRRLAGLGVENPQVAWGADLVSRLDHAGHGADRVAALRESAVTAIAALAHDLTRDTGARTDEIVEATVCGNTAMQHLLLGLPVRQLGRSPFVAASSDDVDVPAAEFGLPFAPGAVVHVAGNVGGFVGSDHVTALLATREIWEAGGTSVVMDIGTNTEISLVHDGRVHSASCPSGPALEGGHIACGMRAAEGAIERVWLDGGRLAHATIGGRTAVGLCGSGVIDLTATLLSAGIVDGRGRLHLGHADTLAHDGRPAARVATNVVFTQSDVRAVQLAKAAIMTGLELLLAEAGIGVEAIDRFVVAGAFGSHVDVGSAIEIGLFPDLPRQRILRVGNSAGVGVARILASRAERRRAIEIARTCRYVELSSRPDFQKRFVHNIGFTQGRGGRP